MLTAISVSFYDFYGKLSSHPTVPSLKYDNYQLRTGQEGVAKGPGRATVTKTHGLIVLVRSLLNNNNHPIT